MTANIDYTSPSTNFTYDVNKSNFFQKDAQNYINVLGEKQLNTLENTSLLDIYLSTGNVDFLTTVLPSLVVLVVDDVKPFFSMSEAALKKGISMYPDSVLANYLLGQLYKKNGDIEKANEVCVKELVENNINLSEGVSDIAGFQLDKTIASSEFAYYIFNVIRDSNTEPKSDLESYIIKVNRNGDNVPFTTYTLTTEEVALLQSEKGIDFRVSKRGTTVNLYLGDKLVVENIDLTMGGAYSYLTKDTEMQIKFKRDDDPGVRAVMKFTIEEK